MGKMTSTTNWIYVGTNVVHSYVIIYKIPIYEVAIPVILILGLLSLVVWLWKKGKNPN